MENETRDCFYCEHCGKPFESTCSNCERCENCCSCYYCEGCDERVSNFCSECDRCSDCCSCEHGPRHAQKFTIKKPTNAKGYKENSSKRPISIELELCSVENDDKLIAWARKTGAGLVEDGSLPDSGVEINTNPASGDYFLQDARSLATALQACGAHVNDTCGLHVHVDASDFSQYDIRRLILLWSAVERSMFDLAGKDRIENDYCRPCSGYYAHIMCGHNLSEWRKRLAIALYKEANRETRYAKREKYIKSRYYALNLHSYFFRKTFEFRLHEGRMDAHILENWPLLCGRLVDVSMRTPERDLLSLVKSDRSSEDVLASVLPAQLSAWMRERLADRREARRSAGTLAQTERMLDSLESGRKTIAQYNPSNE